MTHEDGVPARPGALGRIGPRRAQLTVTYLIFTAVLGSNLPSPIYVIWQREWHFSSGTVTLVFATYGVCVLTSLLCFGRLSDTVGRRPVMTAGLVLAAGATVLFLAAHSVTWLFAARGLQGLATGVLTGSAAAAMVELDPGGDRQRASMINVVAMVSAGATGPLLGGLLTQFAPWPTRLPFVVILALMVVGLLGVGSIPETVDPRAPGDLGFRARSDAWRPRRPSVPLPIRKAFVVAATALAVGWSVGALYAALSPSMESQLLHLTSHAAAGALIFAFNIIGGVAQLRLRTWSTRRVMGIGLPAVALGIVMVQLAIMDHVTGLFYLGTISAGLGQGLSFMGGLALVNEVAPHHRRAEVLSAFSVIGYAAVSVPVVGVGLLTDVLGLTRATGIFTLVIVAVAGLGLLAVVRQPPEPLSRLTAEDRAALALEAN